MGVGRVAAAIDRHALFIEQVGLGQVGVGVAAAVQVVHVLGDGDALGIDPRARADAVTRVHRTGAVRHLGGGQIRAPVGLGRTGRLGQHRAMRIRAFQTAKIGAITLADAGDEEAHIILGLHRGGTRQANGSTGEKQRTPKLVLH